MMTQEEAEALAQELADLAIERGAEAVVVAVAGPGELPANIPPIPFDHVFLNYGFRYRTKIEGMGHWLTFLATRVAMHFGIVQPPQSTNASVGTVTGGAGGGYP